MVERNSLAAVMRQIGEYCEYPELVRVRRLVLEAYAVHVLDRNKRLFIEPAEIAGHVLKLLESGGSLHDVLEMSEYDLWAAVRGD